MLLLARQQQQQQRGLLCCAAVLLSALRATTAATMASSVDARLMSTKATPAAPLAPPPPPALASPGPCGVSEPVRGTVEASNTGDFLKATLVLPTRDNDASTAEGPGLALSPPLFGPAAALAADAAAARCSAPFPLVAFFSGFQSRASSYDRYARHLASWGYASVRYDARLLSITPDSRELGWLADVVAWALRAAPAGTLSSGASSAPSSPDLLFTAGHSRGAKLAALQYAGSLEFARCGGGSSGASGGGDPGDGSFLPRQSLRISSAFLIDPVDNTRFTPASEAYPSAAAALRAQGAEASLAIAAAGRIGACNPLESGYNHFWPAAVGGDSSFLLVLKGAGHATFNDAGRLGNKLGDWLCGGGDMGREAAMGDAGAAMVSWFDSVVSKVKRLKSGSSDESDGGAVSVSLESSGSGIAKGGEEGERVRVSIKKRPSPAPRDAAVPSPSAAFLQEDFLSWARAAAAAGQVEFEVRGGGGVVPPPQPAPCSAKGGAAAAGGGGAPATAAAVANTVVPFRAAAAAAALPEEEAPAAAP